MVHVVAVQSHFRIGVQRVDERIAEQVGVPSVLRATLVAERTADATCRCNLHVHVLGKLRDELIPVRPSDFRPVILDADDVVSVSVEFHRSALFCVI